MLGSSTPEDEDQKISLSMEERLTKLRNIEFSNDQYVKCNFIIGFVAEVERLWSIASYVLAENRRYITPQMFEAFMFLEFNDSFLGRAAGH